MEKHKNLESGAFILKNNYSSRDVPIIELALRVNGYF